MDKYSNIQRVKGTEEDQARLEAGMAQAGRDRYIKRTLKAVQGRDESNTAYGNRLVSKMTDSFSDAIRTWLEKSLRAAGRHHKAIPYLQQLEDRTTAYISLKVIMSSISAHTKLTSLALKIGEALSLEVEMSRLSEEEKVLYKGILSRANKRSQYSRKKYTAKYMAEQNGTPIHLWCKDILLLVGKVLLELCISELGIIEADIQVKNKTQEYIIKPTKECIEWITQCNAYHLDIAAIYEPMVVPPFPWQCPFVGGYITNQVAPITLVKTKNKQYLEKLANVEMPVVYEAVNKIQATPWRINVKLLDLLLNLANTDSELGGLPRASEIPVPEKPKDIDTNEEAKVAWKMEAAAVYQENIRLVSKRAGLFLTLKCAEKYAKYEKIYFPYQLDFRGRVYPVTNGSLSPQGADYVKALLEFAEGEKLSSPEAVDWLAVHVANVWGIDKVSFEDRIAWTKKHSDMLCRIAENPYDNREWTEADKPFQAIAAALEWKGYIENGLNHVSHIAVALDGSCSGLQHLGMALRCEETGAAVNLTPADVPQDIYQRVIDKIYVKLEAIVGKDWKEHDYTKIINIIDEKIEGIYNKSKRKYKLKKTLYEWRQLVKSDKRNSDGTLAKRSIPEQEAHDLYNTMLCTYAWLNYGYDRERDCMSRKLAKSAVMTFPYGSKEYGFKDQLLERVIKPAKIEAMKFNDIKDISATIWSRIWEDNSIVFKSASLLASLLYEAVCETVVKAAEGMEWLQKTAKVVAKKGEPISWKTPIGFLVEQNYWKLNSKTINTSFLGKGKTEFIFKVQGSSIDKMKQASSIAPNFVHSLDATHLMMVVSSSAYIDNWALVHDSFGTLPSRTQELYNNIRASFHQLYTEHDVFHLLHEQVMQKVQEKDLKKVPFPPKKGQLTASSILTSKYCFG
ncbi:DNA-directed RNA polymerase [Zooshikella sp. RANM57]|uniref:DNA-directed RNA polymerase n=1 Tax=Zooshikella sp. RANM57 TaxID=3425863 RepID=UPI003D6ECA5F